MLALLVLASLGGLYYLWRGALQIGSAASGLIAAPTESPASTAPEATAPSADTPTVAAAAATAAQEAPEPTAAPATLAMLQKVRARGRLVCGSGGTLPGFSYVDPAIPNPTSADWSGFDVDFCRAVAVAIFGAPDAVEFVKLSNEQRFAAVLNGDVDVLFRNTTWTSQRDTGVRQGAVGIDFGPTTFYDGQGLLVRADSNINTPADLAGKTVCVASNTTTESNLSDYYRQIGVTIVTRTFSTTDEVYNNYVAQGCAAATSDRSQLFVKLNCARSGRYANCLQLNPDEHKVLPEVMSKEPLGPVVIENDSQWRDVVSWTIFAMIYADELGVTQANVGEQAVTTTDRRIKVLLGLEGAAGQYLGLENDFAARVIAEVGN